MMPATIATTYVAVYKLIPDYLIRKRYFLLAKYCLYTFIISVFTILFSIFFSLSYLSSFQFEDMNPISRNGLFIVTCIYLVVIIASAFKLSKLNYINTIKTNQLETKILETQLKLKENELNYLKMQIHPHFLFNTLNTMYGFALKKADQTPEMILKLSNLLDYLLYQIDKPFVNLEEEIDHIKDYISLEKLRFNDHLKINMVEEYQAGSYKISPMILLPFVENSFKHGRIENGNLTIDISISCQADYIHFKIKNKMEHADKADQGIGLDNIQKRLELLYRNNYNLHIDTQNMTFDVDLKLKNDQNA